MGINKISQIESFNKRMSREKMPKEWRDIFLKNYIELIKK